MRAIARDYAQQGDALWELFHAINQVFPPKPSA
jgi:hypothetical protein